MTQKPDLADLVNKFYAASAEGDFETTRNMMTDNFKITEADNLPFGGVYEGKGALEELFAKVMGMMNIADLRHSHMMVGEDCVCCMVNLVPAEGDGEPISLMELFLFEGDKVSEIRPFYFNADQVKRNCK